MSGWKSRWSWVRLVNTLTANVMPSARPSSSACEDTSIAHAWSPRLRMRTNVSCRSMASPVVRTASSSSPPTTCLTVPSRPVCRPAGLQHVAHQERRGGLAVGAGDARHLQLGGGVAEEGGGHRAHRGPDVVDHHLGHAQAERALAHQRGRAALHGVGGEIVAVDLEAGHTEEERPLGDALARVRQPRDLDLGSPITHQVSQGHGVAKSMAGSDGTGWRRPGTSPPSPASPRSPSPG